MTLKSIASTIGAILVIAGVAIAWDDAQEEVEDLQESDATQTQILQGLQEIHAAEAALAKEKAARIAERRAIREEYCAAGELPRQRCIDLGIRPSEEK
jgi:hypothetical protein